MQTWQTQRGGPGRTRSVDVLKVNAEYVESSSDADRESPIPRFFDATPEYSLLGDFAALDVTWQTTDSLAMTFSEIYDFQTNQSARTSVGGIIEHSEDFRSYVELRYLNARDITLLDLGVMYKLTSKYTLASSVTYDTDEGDVQTVTGTIRRRFPDNTLGVSIAYNNISSETSSAWSSSRGGRAETRAAGLRRRLRADDLNLCRGRRAAWAGSDRRTTRGGNETPGIPCGGGHRRAEEVGEARSRADRLRPDQRRRRRARDRAAPCGCGGVHPQRDARRPRVDRAALAPCHARRDRPGAPRGACERGDGQRGDRGGRDQRRRGVHAGRRRRARNDARRGAPQLHRRHRAPPPRR